MALPASLRSSLNDVLAAVRAQLAAETDIPDGRIHTLAGRQKSAPPHLDADQDILLRLGGFTTDAGHRDRHDCRIVRELLVTLRTRNELDEVNSNASLLGHGDLGAIVHEEDLIDALQNFWPEDGDTNVLLLEPVRVLRGGAYEAGDGWASVELVFGLPIRLPLGQTRA